MGFCLCDLLTENSLGSISSPCSWSQKVLLAWLVSLGAVLIPSSEELRIYSPLSYFSHCCAPFSHAPMYHLHYMSVFCVGEGKTHQQLVACSYLISVDCRNMLITLFLTFETTDLFDFLLIFSVALKVL